MNKDQAICDCSECYQIKGGYKVVKGFLLKVLFVYFVLFVPLAKLSINFKGKLAETSTHNGVDRSAALSVI